MTASERLSPKMKRLTIQETDALLCRIGMRIGDWNRIADLNNAEKDKRARTSYRAPRGSNELHNFSLHVAGWLPKGDWKIFQIDNSTSLDPVQASLFGRLLFGSENVPDFNLVANRTFLFEFGTDESANENTELLISNLIHVFLLFECHGYVVSSGSRSGQLLGIQDGFAYFDSKDAEISGAKSLLKGFERSPLIAPQWIMDIVSKWQERSIASAR